ncbi:MAG TPA: NAD(P)/FAD-dependent oxidoreductase [Polyangium sp.]|nr:NAD(P)/FAD-dependent oxidoreductase [Polyangium sp.]
MYDVVVIGAGIAGMATAARLRAAGLSTLVLEAHGLPGGCAGYFRRKGFAFDVGATTLVDFAPGGVGAELLETIGMPALPGERLPGYVAWLPDRKVTLHRDQALWADERLRMLGNSPAHRRLWMFFDRIADVFWGASRRGVQLPLRSPMDAIRAARCLAIRDLPLVRYLGWTVGDALRHYGLYEDKPLISLLAMLIEDTVHGRIETAPLINGVLGATIRGTGLTRAYGGMYGFWRRFTAHYRALGGQLRVGTTVRAFRGRAGDFVIQTQRGDFHARRVISALPAPLTARIGPPEVGEALAPYIRRDAKAQGGAVVVFLGVPDTHVAEQSFTHHQILHDYESPLGEGNNMFISVSAADDIESAPAGFRSVMLSTHCELSPWQNLDDAVYEAHKKKIGNKLVELARRVYPTLGENAVVHEVATPRTYERFTRRPGGAVGGARLSLANSNQRAIPHDIGFPGFWMVGDSTWPGLGTVACVLGSRNVAQSVLQGARTSSDWILDSGGRADVA